jgi:tetratricopeptide (TPR) repeat protein
MNWRSAIHQGSGALLIALAVFRCLVVFFPTMYFDQDPRLAPVIEMGFGPAESILLDVLSLLAAGLCLATARRLHVGFFMLAALGAGAAAAHGALDAHSLRIGSGWIAALSTGIAAVHFDRESPLRRLAFALVLGLVGTLAIRGIYQVGVEHPRTLEQFRANREQVLALQGHAPGSVGAKLFERRLVQPEATAWLGLANVYGSIVGACLLAWITLTIATWRRVLQRNASLLLALTASAGALLALAALYLSHSKGAFGAVLIGVLAGIFALARLRSIARQRETDAPAADRALPLGSIIALGVVVIVLLGVVVRGLIGERLDPGIELSLLFRWQYMIGAVRAWLYDPVFGVGPGGFKTIYQLVKPPLSTEEITSPHSVLFDYVSMLGIGGAAWGVLFLALTWRIGRLIGRHDEPDPASEFEPHAILDRLYAPAGIALLTAVIALRFESIVLLDEDLIARLVGAGAFALLALAAMAVLRHDEGGRTLRLALWVAIITLIAQGQIEMTFTHSGSAALAWLVLGLAAGAKDRGSETVQRADRLNTGVAGVAVLIGALLLLTLGWRPIATYQGHLRDAAMTLSPVGELRLDAGRVLVREPGARAQLVRRLGDFGITAPPTDDRSLARLVLDEVAPQLELRLVPTAVDHLERAAAVRPGRSDPQSEIVRLRIVEAQTAEARDDADAARTAWDAAAAAAESLLADYPGEAGNWQLAMRLYIERYRRTTEFADLGRALDCSSEWIALDPRNWRPALAMADLLHDLLGDAAEASTWYARALELNEQHRLDPLEQMGDADLERSVERAAPMAAD